MVADWRGQGLATELVGGLVQHATHTGLMRRLLAHISPTNPASQQVLLHNDFQLAGTTADGRLRFEREVAPAVLPVAS